MERTSEQIMELFKKTEFDSVKIFFEWFEPELLEVCKEIEKCYMYEKEYEILDRGNIQANHLIKLTMQTFDSILTAFSLFVIGYHVPSNHMIRQSFESMFLSILVSTHKPLNVSKRIPNAIFYEAYHRRLEFTYGFKAEKILSANLERLSINADAFNNMVLIYKHYHNYSHPSIYSLLTRFDFQNSMECWGPNHNPDHKEIYDKEFETRIGLLKRFRIITQTNLERILSDS
jgi:hypothetical protein